MVLFFTNVVVFGQIGCIWTKLVAFAQKRLYSYKSGCIRAKVVVIGLKRLHSGKFVVFGESGCIGQKWLYSGKMVVFGQSGCIRGKVVIFRQKWL